MQERRVCAQAWLRALEFAGGGWGHVEQTGANADSTAFALIFFRARGGAGSASWQLHAHWQADGRFSTFIQDRQLWRLDAAPPRHHCGRAAPV